MTGSWYLLTRKPLAELKCYTEVHLIFKKSYISPATELNTNV